MGFSSNIAFRLGAVLNGILVGFVFSRKLDTGENTQEQMLTGWRKFINAKVICGSIYLILNLLMLIFIFV
jgi:hypothetical protein